MNLRIQVIRTLNACFILVLSVVLIAAYFYQYTTGHSPCKLCELQRLFMLCVSFGLLLNLRIKISAAHYGVSMIASLAGACVSLRQISLHICPQFSHLGTPVMGLQIYTWALIVFCSALFVIAILLLCIRSNDVLSKLAMNRFEKFVAVLILALAVTNFLTAFYQCGFRFCR